MKRLNTKLALAVVAGVTLFSASGYYWYQKILTNPKRVINGMLDKSLNTTGVQRQVSQKSQQGSVLQSAYLSFSPETFAQTQTQLEETSFVGRTKVTTETIGQQKADYIRYKAIDVSGGKSDGIKDVLNVWGKREQNIQTGQSVSFLNDGLLLAVPFGNLNAEQRAEVKNEINKTKLYDFSKSKTEYINGRPVITYTIDLDPQALVQVLAKYVQVTNVGNSAELNPANYEGVEKIQISMQVDVLSRHLKSVEFGNSGRKETYSGYGTFGKVAIPDKTIDINELQTRLQKLEQQQQ